MNHIENQRHPVPSAEEVAAQGSKEQKTASLEGALDNAAAQEEANMMRSVLKQEPSRSRILDPETSLFRETTAADYDQALLVVEEIKRLAEEEPNADKILYKIARITNKSVEGLLFTLQCLAKLPEHVLEKKAYLISGEMEESHAQIMSRFEDAAERLKQLQNKAKSIGQDLQEVEDTAVGKRNKPAIHYVNGEKVEPTLN